METQNTWPFIERRCSPRLSRVVDVDYSIENKEYEREITFGRNIGTGGICLVTYEDIADNSVLLPKIALSDIDYYFQVRAKIAWKKDSIFGSQSRKRYEVGLAFIELKENDRQKISEYILSACRQS